MLDMYSDLTQHAAQLDTHIEVLEMCDLAARIQLAGGMTNVVNRWCAEAPTHHCALGVGHIPPVLRSTAALLHLPAVEVR